MVRQISVAEREGLGPWVFWGRNRAREFKRKPSSLSRGDRVFESVSLQRRVRCEPDFPAPLISLTEPAVQTSSERASAVQRLPPSPLRCVSQAVCRQGGFHRPGRERQGQTRSRCCLFHRPPFSALPPSRRSVRPRMSASPEAVASTPPRSVACAFSEAATGLRPPHHHRDGKSQFVLNRKIAQYQRREIAPWWMQNALAVARTSVGNRSAR
jgi:hypothetical protein